jgi:hypothetical protein
MENASMEKTWSIWTLSRWKMTGKCPWKKHPWKKPGVFGLLVQVENEWKMSMDKVSMEKTWSIWTLVQVENVHGKIVYGHLSMELHGNLSMELD